MINIKQKKRENYEGAIRCSICKKKFDIFDIQENIRFKHRFRYGSIYDGCTIELNLCCSCTDKLIGEYIIPNCCDNPMSDPYQDLYAAYNK